MNVFGLELEDDFIRQTNNQNFNIWGYGDDLMISDDESKYFHMYKICGLTRQITINNNIAKCEAFNQTDKYSLDLVFKPLIYASQTSDKIFGQALYSCNKTANLTS